MNEFWKNVDAMYKDWVYGNRLEEYRMVALPPTRVKRKAKVGFLTTTGWLVVPSIKALQSIH
jgi:hypothetical protein